jgi:hypothetical protein
MTAAKVRRRGAKRTELDPIEKASRDEISAVQAQANPLDPPARL